MNIRQRFASIGFAALMAVTAVGGVGTVASAHSNHNPIVVVADIQDAQASYAAGHYLTANRRAIIALRDLRGVHTPGLLYSIGCDDEFRLWADRAIVKMDALRIAAFGQGTHWRWAASPRIARTLALTVYARAAARYHTAEDALVDCVLNALPTPPIWLLDLGF